MELTSQNHFGVGFTGSISIGIASGVGSVAPFNSYYTTTDLKRRGWTRRLIQRFLGVADTSSPNPHFKRGRPMAHFGTDRVHSVELRDEFTHESLASTCRRQAVQKVIEGKTQALIDLAQTVQPVLPAWTPEELDQQAFEMFGIQVDWIEHQRAQISALVEFCSSSETVLDDFFWHPGIRPARIIIRRKVLAMIIQSYPQLGDLALDWSKREKGNAQIDIFLA